MAIPFITNLSGETVAAFTPDEVSGATCFAALVSHNHTSTVAATMVGWTFPKLTDEFLDWLVR